MLLKGISFVVFDCILCSSLVIASAEQQHAHTFVSIPKALANHLAIQLALSDLSSALGGVHVDTNDVDFKPPENASVIVVSCSETSLNESYIFRPRANGIGIFSHSVRGTAYALFDLAARARRHDIPHLWSLNVAESPSFALRTWSEEGQLLDIPDRGYTRPCFSFHHLIQPRYYTDDSPYVNLTLYNMECSRLLNIGPTLLKVPALLRVAVRECFAVKHKAAVQLSHSAEL